jgi:hypothetical protein
MLIDSVRGKSAHELWTMLISPDSGELEKEISSVKLQKNEPIP